MRRLFPLALLASAACVPVPPALPAPFDAIVCVDRGELPDEDDDGLAKSCDHESGRHTEAAN